MTVGLTTCGHLALFSSNRVAPRGSKYVVNGPISQDTPIGVLPNPGDAA